MSGPRNPRGQGHNLTLGRRLERGYRLEDEEEDGAVGLRVEIASLLGSPWCNGDVGKVEC
jgi:hypothetical protein